MITQAEIIPTEPAQVMLRRETTKKSSISLGFYLICKIYKMRYLIPILFFFSIQTTAIGQHTITGVVTNHKGEKLSFATVFLEGTSFAASTDEHGYYSINGVTTGNHALKATFIGYQAFKQNIVVTGDLSVNIVLAGEIYNLDLVEIQANRVKSNAPFSNQIIHKKTLQKENLGQDVPFLLQWTPSMVVTSDAGTGVGYTGLRLRGSDQTRINVTINGVPLNDAESHNVFWVDLPDLMGSVNNIQIQRGVGTSTNGAGAFGGTVSVNTNDIRVNPYIDVAATYGDFNTRKLNVNLGTGLINDRFYIDGRYSIIKSHGYVDRATSDLNSFAFTAARITAKSSLKLNILQGKEITYQSWYGVPQAKINGSYEQLLAHYYTNLGSIYLNAADSINLFNSDRRYNYYTYPNQVDNYKQTHYQLIHALALNPKLKTKTTLYYTKGKGYFEEFKYNDKLEKYQMANIIDANGNEVSRSNIVRRRWLDNDLLGIILDAEYFVDNQWTIQSGITANTYTGDHFGNVIQSSVHADSLDKTRRYYDNTGHKSDISAYLRGLYDINEKWSMHGDVQLRKVDYKVKGIDNDLRNIDLANDFLFFNPKFGTSYQLDEKQQTYISIAVAHKEPSRGDFIDNAFSTTPKPEKLYNWEAGYRYLNTKTKIESNVYYMLYQDQLVLTGELNDVGATVRVNVPDSYRLGWETTFSHQFSNKWAISANTTLSRNKIQTFDEIIADYTVDFEKVTITHKNTDISFSPNLVGAIQLIYKPQENLEAEWSTKYVGNQFLDNTSNQNRSLPAYSYQNLRLTYQMASKYWKNMDITFMVNNVFNQLYASNGYTYSYTYEDTITENFVYPQAGRNWMLGIKIGL